MCNFSKKHQSMKKDKHHESQDVLPQNGLQGPAKKPRARGKTVLPVFEMLYAGQPQLT